MPENAMNMSYAMPSEYSAFPAQTPVGMCYVPMQRITTVYEPENAYVRGTLFPDLDKPFLGGKGMMK